MKKITCDPCKNKITTGDGAGYYIDPENYRVIREQRLEEAEFHLCTTCDDAIGWNFFNRNREKIQVRIKEDEETPF